LYDAAERTSVDLVASSWLLKAILTAYCAIRAKVKERERESHKETDFLLKKERERELIVRE